MSLFKKKILSNTRQKNRKVKIHSKKNLIFGNCGVLLVRQLYIENVHFRFIRLMLRRRKKNKKKRVRFGLQKYWIRCGKNIFFSKKSKNSRMGSGKGNFVRKATRIGINKTFLEFKNKRHGSLYSLILVLRHRLKVFSRIVYAQQTLIRVTAQGDVRQNENLDNRLIRY